MGFPIGIQLYSLREKTQKDFLGTLEKVAQIGYQGVEFAGYGGILASQMKEHLDRLGLKAISSHVPLERLENYIDEEISYAKQLEMPYIVCPWATFENMEDIDRIAKILDIAGQKCFEAGITLLYHNHDHEFKTIDDKYILDILFEKTNPQNVKAQLDLCWVSKGGVDEVEYVQKYKGRCPILHAKDYIVEPKFRQVEVGTGIVNFKGIKEVAKSSGVEWLIVEQEEYTIDPFESIEVSLQNLIKLGLAK